MDRIWETTYRHDRRKHRHRCKACSRIIKEGERVLMLRPTFRRGTWAIHIDCTEMRTPEGVTYRTLAEQWATP